MAIKEYDYGFPIPRPTARVEFRQLITFKFYYDEESLVIVDLDNLGWRWNPEYRKWELMFEFN